MQYHHFHRDEADDGSKKPQRLAATVIDELEARWLLTAPQILGNTGQILSSQFQPFGFKTRVGNNS